MYSIEDFLRHSPSTSRKVLYVISEWRHRERLVPFAVVSHYHCGRLSVMVRSKSCTVLHINITLGKSKVGIKSPIAVAWTQANYLPQSQQSGLLCFTMPYLFTTAFALVLVLSTHIYLIAAVPALGPSSFIKRQSTNGTTNSSVPLININGTPNSTLEATAWSLIVNVPHFLSLFSSLILGQYTYPIYIWANFAGSVLRNVSVNTIFHQRGLASISSAAVIKPNVDTLYSRVVLDLSQNDVALTIPNISDGRYWNYPLYDL